MSRLLAFPDTVRAELRRLDAAEAAALRVGDVYTFVHSRLIWCELLLTRYPKLARMTPSLGRKIANLLPGAAGALPRWKRELLARPLVPIVRRTLTTHKLPGGGISHGAAEKLACGHVHSLTVLVDGDLRARRRRCKACGDALLEAVDRRDRFTLARKANYGNR